MARTRCGDSYLPRYCAAWLEGLATTLPDPARVLEVGTGSGCSFATLLMGLSRHDDVHGWTVDIEERPYLDEQMAAFGIPKSRYTGVHAPSLLAAASWSIPLDMLYIDADHTEEGETNDIKSWTPHLKFGGILAIDDYEVTAWSVTEVVDDLLFAAESDWRFIGQVGKLIAFEKGTRHKRSPWITDDMWKYDSHAKDADGTKDPWLLWAWGFMGRLEGPEPHDYGKGPKKRYTKDLP